MTTNSTDTTRSGALTTYIVTGVVTWPIVTLAIYYADRFANMIADAAAPGPSIGFWAASLYALAFSALVIVAGWVQSELRSKG